MKIILDGKKIETNATTLYDLSKEVYSDNFIKYYGAFINGDIFGLHWKIKEGDKISFFDITHKEGMRIYQATLRYIMSYAINLLYPGVRIIYNYSVSRGIFCQIVGNKKVSLEMVELIEKTMNNIIDQDLPINLVKAKTTDLINIYTRQGYKSKADIVRAIKGLDEIDTFTTNGYYNNLDSWLCPRTSYTPKFKLKLYIPGIILQYPRSELNGEIPEFKDELILSKYLKEQNKWGQITNASYILDYNRMIRTGEVRELINLCETRHNINLAELGNKIEKDIDNIRLICVSGPSSSGKTTFTNKLRIQLKARGITPLMISLDNYYRGDGKFPLNDDGTPDFEHIEALDLDLFNKNILDLINGESVSLPIFDFKTRTVTFQKPIKINKRQPIMIEGIHGLNERLTASVPSINKFRIYIAPQAQFHIDSQCPFSLTDIRLLRRLIRDYRERGADPRKTIRMWDSVRRGEFKWIYPYQENADFVFNSELTYELGVLRAPAMKILSLVKPEDPEYYIAIRLIRIITYFEDVDPKWIPCDSLIREFVGGSIFYDEE